MGKNNKKITKVKKVTKKEVQNPLASVQTAEADLNLRLFALEQDNGVKENKDSVKK